jgi:predicted nucleic acid-binding protein
MTGAVFVDANVLVYERDVDQPEKRERAVRWMEHLWLRRNGRLSIQILNEFYVTATQRLKPGLAREAARLVVRNLLAWRPLVLDRVVIEGAFSLQDRFPLSFWDSLVVASAREAACRYLLTEDLGDGEEYDGVEVVNPFTHPPGTLPK